MVIGVIGLKDLPARSGASRSFENIMNHIDAQFHLYSRVMNMEAHRRIIRASKKSGFLYSLRKVLFSPKKNIDLYWVHHVIYWPHIVVLLILGKNVIYTNHGKAILGVTTKNLVKYIYCVAGDLVLRFLGSKIRSVYVSSTDNSGKSIVIPNAVIDVKVEKKKITKTNTLLLATARNIGLKNIDFVLEYLSSRHHGYKLVLICPNLTKSQEAMLNHIPHVHFEFLSRDELVHQICKAEYAVFPSVQESNSNMLLELAVLGNKLIVSDIPNNKEIVSEEDAAYFSIGSFKSFEKSLARAKEQNVVTFEARRAKLMSARSPEIIGKKYSNLFHNV